MKKLTILFITVITVVALSMLVFSFKKSGATQEKTMIYGPTVKTEEMHNALCEGVITTDYKCFDKFKFRKYVLSVSAPDGWDLTGEPVLNCVQDNEGSCAWNGGFWNRAVVLESSPKLKKVLVYLSSRSIMVNLKCEATKK